MNGTPLTGLEGTNPLGFLAALGVQVAFTSESDQPSLWWSDDVTPHALVDCRFSVERIADQALKVFKKWRDSPALNPKRADGSAMPKGDALKLRPPDIREYLGRGSQCDSAGRFVTALVAEGSLDNQGAAKPSDLYFTAGQMKFLYMIRQIMGGVTRKDVLGGLIGPWSYQSKLPSLMWDVCDDRVYALRSDDPSKVKKLTNPGPEALAVLGLSLHPVFAGRGRTYTQGCSGAWKSAWFSWPIWRKPARPRSVNALLAHARGSDRQPAAADRQAWFPSWGVVKIHRSRIRRSRQGGYGTFAPPETPWQLSMESGEPRRKAWSRLINTMDRMGAEASKNGLTPKKLEALLADED